jgi:hypothetical protein
MLAAVMVVVVAGEAKGRMMLEPGFVFQLAVVPAGEVGGVMMMVVGAGQSGVAAEAGRDHQRQAENPWARPVCGGLIGVFPASLQSIHASLPQTRCCHVFWLRVDCGGRNAKMRQNYNRERKSSWVPYYGHKVKTNFLFEYSDTKFNDGYVWLSNDSSPQLRL